MRDGHPSLLAALVTARLQPFFPYACRGHWVGRFVRLTISSRWRAAIYALSFSCILEPYRPGRGEPIPERHIALLCNLGSQPPPVGPTDPHSAMVPKLSISLIQLWPLSEPVGGFMSPWEEGGGNHGRESTKCRDGHAS